MDDSFRTEGAPSGTDSEPRSDRLELTTAFALLWVVSVVRVVAALAHGETFGTVPTLALLSIVLLPVLGLSLWPRRVAFHLRRGRRK